MDIIQHIEVPSGGTTAIEFNPISGDYDDLYITLSLRSTLASNRDDIVITVNGDTGASYYHQRLIGYDGTNKTSGNGGPLTPTSTWMFVPANGAGSGVFGTISVYIKDYAFNDKYKTLAFQAAATNTNTSSWVTGLASLWWTNPNAITSLKFESRFSTGFVEYSSATLYGIRKYDTATTAPKATGGIISFDSANNNWVHTFTASGTFTPTEDITCEYLVVAGGGGGGGGDNGYPGGGGGAGGYRSSVSGESSGGGASAETPLSLTASTGYTVTVGAGGAKGVGTSGGASTNGSNGVNSTLHTITATGGGGGAAGDQSNILVSGNSGGSGGGGGTGPSAGSSGGSGTANEGYDGGSGEGAGYDYGGGGGGASAVGVSATAVIAGDGGDGVQSSITGVAIYRAGGGGGGTFNEALATGGAGGGGVGSSVVPAINAGAGLPGSGGGGGGGGDAAGTGRDSAPGGSGIVIVRYAA